MPNPGAADATADEPAVWRWIGFAQRRGRGRFVALTRFAFPATIPPS